MDLLLPASFWGWWTAGIVALGLCGWVWLSWGMARAKDARAPDHAWDETLREGNDAPPKWWFAGLFAALIFSAAYIFLYPALGDNKGYLQWNQYKQLADGMAYYEARTADARAFWRAAPLGELRQNKNAMQTAGNLYAVHCAACHGEDGAGQAGVFPSLADDKWHWGGGDAEILQSIAQGRVAAMPAWGAAFDDAQIAALADYVLALAEGNTTTQSEAAKIYAANCAACHGAAGEGDATLGAPGFAGEWQYVEAGDVRAGIIKSIKDGRQGVMPAQAGRLTNGQIRLLAAYLGSSEKFAAEK